MMNKEKGGLLLICNHYMTKSDEESRMKQQNNLILNEKYLTKRYTERYIKSREVTYYL